MLRYKPKFTLPYAFRLLSISLLSVMTSLLNLPASVVYGRRVARTRIAHPPIFILGHWRSGTTLLHNLMTLDPETTYADLYRCLFPGHFLLTERLVPKLTEVLLPKSRPMDNMAATWHTPQEDEIALLLDCGLSPYLCMAFHMRQDIYGRFYDPRDMTPKERAAWKASLLRFIRKLTLRKNRPVVLKSPNHTYRITTLLEMFPEAKFVYIYRDPFAVYPSTLHARNTMFVENALFPFDPEGNEEEMVLMYEKCIRAYEATKSQIPSGNLCELCFEDLEVNPVEEVAKVYQTLGLKGWSTVEPLIRAEASKWTAYTKNSFPMDRATRQKIYERIQWIFDLYGYPGPREEPEVSELREASRHA